jgi:hypothetical protein
MLMALCNYTVNFIVPPERRTAAQCWSYMKQTGLAAMSGVIVKGSQSLATLR